MMRILVVSQYFWPEGFRINDLVISMVERGHKVDVLTGKPNYPAGSIFPGYQVWGSQRETWQGAEILRVPIFLRGSRSSLKLALNYLSFIVFGTLFGTRLCSGKSYDVVFVYAPSPILQAIPALFLGRIKRAPVVLWVQDLWPESLEATGYVRNKLLLELVKQLVRWIYRHTDLLLGQSRSFVDEISKLAPDKAVDYYPNSVEAMFSTNSHGLDPAIEGLNTGFPVVFAGNIGSAQAVETILDAATLLKDHKDIRFVVIGDGSKRTWMQEETKARGLKNVYLPGRFPVEAMPSAMRRASALLVTLTDKPIFASTIPNKVQAYLAAGRPIIACLNGEGAQLVKEAGAGIAVAAEDAVGLSEAVLRLYRLSPEEQEHMGENGRRCFREQFDHEMLVDRLLDIFDDLTKFREDS